jgi:2-C-methyl-D-erythritol 4-phosphate cytidylyltransferase
MSKEKREKNKEPLAVVILAAGSSLRMGGIKKEFQKIKDDENLTVLGSALKAFVSIPSVETIVIAVSENSETIAREILPPELLSAQKPKILFVNGGSSRRASVFNALSLLAGCDLQYALIHDGARPWVSRLLIENIIKAVKIHNAVIPLLPLSDTPKQITKNKEQGTNEEGQAVFIKSHLKRANIGVAQTPQAFKFPQILHAHEEAEKLLSQKPDEEFTDDAEIWGRFCGPVAAIPGDPANKKITYPEDLN